MPKSSSPISDSTFEKNLEEKLFFLIENYIIDIDPEVKSVRSLAIALGLNRDIFYQIKSGRLNLTTKILKRLVDRYSINVNWFFYDGQPMVLSSAQDISPETDHSILNVLPVLGVDSDNAIEDLIKKNTVLKEDYLSLQKKYEELSDKYISCLEKK